MFAVSRSAALAAFVLLCPGVAGAQATPSAEQIFARHIAAIGGKEAVLKVQSIKSSGKLDMPALGISATMQAVAAAPNRSAMRMTIPGMGEIANGYDGAVAWELNPMQGPRIKSEKDRIAAEEESDFYGVMLFLKERYQSAETVGAADFGGEKTWQVRTVLKSGRVVNEFFSVATGLKVGSQTTQESQAGSVNVSTVESDYKDFDGLKVPTRSELTTGAQKVVITLTDVTFGSVSESAFALPEAVKALVKR